LLPLFECENSIGAFAWLGGRDLLGWPSPASTWQCRSSYPLSSALGTHPPHCRVVPCNIPLSPLYLRQWSRLEYLSRYSYLALSTVVLGNSAATLSICLGSSFVLCSIHSSSVIGLSEMM
jgi:hypothetical protein